MDTLLMLNLYTVEELRNTSNYLEDFLRDNVPTFNTLDSKDAIDNIIDSAVFSYVIDDKGEIAFANAAIEVLDEVEQELRAKGCVPIPTSLHEGNDEGAILYGETYYYLEGYIKGSVRETMYNDSMDYV